MRKSVFKRVGAFALIAVMSLSTVGCGDDNKTVPADEEKSSYLNELVNCAKAEKGVTSAEISLKLDESLLKSLESDGSQEAEVVPAIPAIPGVSADALKDITLRLEETVNDEDKTSIKVTVKKDNNESKVTELIFDDQTIYINAYDLVNASKPYFGEEEATQLDSIISLLGVDENTQFLKVDTDAINELMTGLSGPGLPEMEPEMEDDEVSESGDIAAGIDMPTGDAVSGSVMFDKENKKILMEDLEQIAGSLESAFKKSDKKITGVDGDYYTLDLNTDNLFGFIKSCRDSISADRDKYTKMMQDLAKFFGTEDSEVTESFEAYLDEVIDIDITPENEELIKDRFKDQEMVLSSRIKPYESDSVKADFQLSLSVQNAFEINVEGNVDENAEGEVNIPENAVDLAEKLNDMQNLSGGFDDIMSADAADAADAA